jgi:hypothetical protein
LYDRGYPPRLHVSMGGEILAGSQLVLFVPVAFLPPPILKALIRPGLRPRDIAARISNRS